MMPLSLRSIPTFDLSTDYGNPGQSLVNIGNAFMGSFEKAQQQGQQNQIKAELAQAAKSGDYETIGKKLIGMGDVQGGTSLLKLGEAQRLQQQQLQAGQAFSSQIGGLLGGGGVQAPGETPSAPSINGSGRARTMSMPGTPDPVAADLPPHQRALLNAIAVGESGGRYDVRYTPKGGASFADFGAHPGVMEPGPHGPSSAAGRYQFTKTTWDGLTGGNVPFTPENQDRMAVQLAQRDYKSRTGRDLDADLQANGFTPQIAQALAPTWQALKADPARFASAYQSSLQRYGSADAPAPGSQPVQFAIPGQGGAPQPAQRGPGGIDPQRLVAAIPTLAAAIGNPSLPEATRAQAKALYDMALKYADREQWTTETDAEGNQIQVNQRTGQRSVLRAAQEQTRTLRPDEFEQYGIDPAYRGPVQLTSRGELKFPGKASTQITNTVGAGEGEFEKTAGKKQAERWDGYVTAGDAAMQRLGDIESLREASRAVGSQGSAANVKQVLGPILEAGGIKVEGLSDIQFYDSVAKRLAPQLRAPGSGSTSDVEYKGFIASLGTLSNNPAAREMIFDTFEAASRNEIARADIATRLFNKEISRSDAEKELRALPTPLQAFREFRKQNPDLVGEAIKAGRESDKKPAPGAVPAPPKVGDVQQNHRYKGGNPADPASWERIQ